MDNRSLQAVFYRLRSNTAFELFVVFVIVSSALLIGAKTYELSSSVQSLLYWMDLGITAIFLIEIIIRFLGEEQKTRFLLRPWNLFDTMIVVISLIPIDDSDMALLGRLVRVFRVLRMVSIIPELRLLINSLIKAMPQLGYVIALMFIIFYIYAAVGSMFFDKINPVLWGDIAHAMLTLFRVMTFEDWTDVMYETMEVYPLSWAYYLSFIFFTAFAFLNMVIGIVVQVLEQESRAMAIEAAGKQPVSLETLHEEIQSLKQMLRDRGSVGAEINLVPGSANSEQLHHPLPERERS